MKITRAANNLFSVHWEKSWTYRWQVSSHKRWEQLDHSPLWTAPWNLLNLTALSECDRDQSDVRSCIELTLLRLPDIPNFALPWSPPNWTRALLLRWERFVYWKRIRHGEPATALRGSMVYSSTLMFECWVVRYMRFFLNTDGTYCARSPATGHQFACCLRTPHRIRVFFVLRI